MGVEIRLVTCLLVALLGALPALGSSRELDFRPDGKWYVADEGSITINGAGPFSMGTSFFIATSGDTVCLINNWHVFGEIAVSRLYIGTIDDGRATIPAVRILKLGPRASAPDLVLPLELFFGKTRIVYRYIRAWENQPRHDLFDRALDLDREEVAICEKELIQRFVLPRPPQPLR